MTYFVLYERRFFDITKCPLCGNEDQKYFGVNNKGETYCRRCVSFIGEEAKNEIFLNSFGHLEINYELSEDQKRVSDEVFKNYRNKENTLIYAVCGAGKTELVYQTIEFVLKNGGRVGFGIPRRDVVIELSERLKSAFKGYKVISLYGGHTSDLNGDIICLTTHQLYRYENYFDLLILDEVDAFPFKDDFVLNAFFKRSVKGNYIIMSATPSEKLLDEYKKGNNKVVTLFKRYHSKKIPEPTLFVAPKIICYLYLIYKVRKILSETDFPLLVFAPTIEECENLYTLLKIFAKQGYLVHSKRKDRAKTIQKFRDKEFRYLVTTSVLERGITLKNLQVIVFNSSSFIYTKEALIQIAGRVGRKIGATNGEVIFIGQRKTEEMVQARATIQDANKNL